MSAKKSWDIQPSRRRISQSAQRATNVQTQPAPQQRSIQSRRGARVQMPRRKQKPEQQPRPQAIRRPPPVPQGRDREPLKDRRRRMRRRRIFATLIIFILLIGGALGGLWWKSVRIQAVLVSGPDSNGMQAIASQELQGTNHFVIPNNSIFFYPQQNIHALILRQYPDIAAVSISRTSFSTILISSIPRQAALTWCGATYEGNTVSTSVIVASSTASDSAKVNAASQADASSTSDAAASAESVPTCYSADAQGIIFAVVPPSVVQDPDSLVIYAPLAGDANVDSPIGSTIAEASVIPNALQFVKVIKSLGVSITTLVLRGDEADLYAQSGTRITYVLGREAQTAQVAEAAFPHLNLDDGSLEYVDLRFAGKAYYKPFGSASASSTPSQ